jgi:Ni/Co efflux regulator RcnB
MRKILLAALAATVFVPAGASAQSAREIRHDQREINRDVRQGRYNEAREDRNELREDWRAYRRTHRSLYNRSNYIAPRGYRYRPVSVGVVLNRLFWGPNYRIGNYATYRLPYPGRHRAWVRYGNDVVLINTRNGRVITVYNDFFY